MRNFTDGEIEELADSLYGSSQSIEEAVATRFPGRDWAEDAAEDDCAALDDLVFECDVCN